MNPNGPSASAVQHIAKWLNEMAALARHPNDERPTAQTLLLMGRMLADSFPTSAFTIDSMQAALHGNIFFPAYEETRRTIADWWRENRPPSAPALTGPAAPEAKLSVLDRSWLDYWYRRIALINAKDPIAVSDPTQAPRAILASLIRQQSPAAWKVISKGDYAERPVEGELKPSGRTVPITRDDIAYTASRPPPGSLAGGTAQ